MTLQNTTHDIIEISRLLSFILDLKDPYTADHSKVVRTISVYLGRKLGFPDKALIDLNIGGYMHDIGKIKIPDSILFKPGRLTDEEFSVIKTHTTFGAEFIDKFSALNRYRDLVLYHHEKYNSYGYPQGLSGNAIPPEARLISLADVYHALYSKRCYKHAFSEQEILDEFSRCRGTQFDPYLTDELLSAIDNGEIEALLHDDYVLESFEAELHEQLTGIDFAINLSSEEQVLQMIDVLASALNIMNPPYASHCKNVTETTKAIVDQLKLDTSLQQDIVIAASLHDIGRMGQRPGDAPTGPQDTNHALIGEEMLKNITCLASTLPMIRHHHEKYDGNGQPDSLKKQEIPLGARVIAIADTFDAFCKRPDPDKGRLLTKTEARERIEALAGRTFDPDLVSVFSSINELFE